VVSVEKVDGDYQGEPTYQLKITLDAQNSQNIFQCSRYSFVGRDILSRLANVDSIAYMAITPYVSEADNGQSYVRCSLKVSSSLEDLMDDNSKIKPIDKALIPTVKEVKVGNKKVLDSEARDKFFDDIVNNIKGKILPMPKYVSVAEPSTADEAPF
jgi:L-lysine 2,3-aminomutase